MALRFIGIVGAAVGLLPSGPALVAGRRDGLCQESHQLEALDEGGGEATADVGAHRIASKGTQSRGVQTAAHKLSSASVFQQFFAGKARSGRTLCVERGQGGLLGCRVDCDCAWFDQCYPKLTQPVDPQREAGRLGALPRVDIGVCETSMVALALVSVGIFFLVLFALMFVRVLVQWRELNLARCRKLLQAAQVDGEPQEDEGAAPPADEGGATSPPVAAAAAGAEPGASAAAPGLQPPAARPQVVPPGQ